MPIFRQVSPALDGASVDLGTSRLRHLSIPAGEYATPFWLRFDGDPDRVEKVSSLPWRAPRVAGSLEVLSPPLYPAGPLSVSGDNPRYMAAPDGTCTYLTGAHFWSTMVDSSQTTDPPPAFDFDVWLDFVDARNHNCFRLWTWEHTYRYSAVTGDVFFAPLPWNRPGPGTALDGKPKWDLTSFNATYFDRLRTRVKAAGQRGFYVAVMLFNGFSVDDKGRAGGDPWDGHPMNGANNVNGVDGDPNADGNGKEAHRDSVAAVTSAQQDYVREVVDTVGHLPHVLYEISNESPLLTLSWQETMRQTIRDRESALGLQHHPVGITREWNGTSGTSDADLLATTAEWMSDTGSVSSPEVRDGTKVVLADTDHYCGVCGDIDWPMKEFCRGSNPIYMDPYNGEFAGAAGGTDETSDPTHEGIRFRLGYAKRYADRMNLNNAVPSGGLSSTGYCLAKVSDPGAEYFAYAPTGGDVTLDLSGTTETLDVEWFDPVNDATQDAGTVSGGSASEALTNPFGGKPEAAVFLKAGI